MPRISRIAIVEEKVNKIEEAARLAAAKAIVASERADTAARVSLIHDEKLTKFLGNDWVHAQARAAIMDAKLNMVLAVITITVLGVFVPLAVKLWSTWLD